MNDERFGEMVQNYLVPLGLTIFVLTVSELLNFIEIKNALIAFALCASLLGVLFLGQFWAFHTIRTRERDALFRILTMITFSGARQVPTSGRITESEVLALEATAHEVWIYAYDLHYEEFDENRSAFTEAVIGNLQLGVRYRYLLPESDGLKSRGRRLRECLEQYASGNSEQLQFRVTAMPPFNSITIYNPSTGHNSARGSSKPSKVAVSFPQADEYSLPDTMTDSVFHAVRGPQALVQQEHFDRVWKDATPLGSEQKV